MKNVKMYEYIQTKQLFVYEHCIEELKDIDISGLFSPFMSSIQLIIFRCCHHYIKQSAHDAPDRLDTLFVSTTVWYKMLYLTWTAFNIQGAKQHIMELVS